ncbi:hypothetical protein CEXT_368391 [Caerostris extrusa]|uniref:Lipase domain-containing protein n=1 Tax=Caerostris extrusa TaxID=172846 RepID=A0AAV4VQ48_CAEEX|nr:hypothetical protein CEXT_368391 [Caerostris extrusa]
MLESDCMDWEELQLWILMASISKMYSAIVKLEQSDALFVDVIHTDPARNVLEGLGTPEDIGHVNFWTNGFRNKTCIPQRTLATGATAIERMPVRGGGVSQFGGIYADVATVGRRETSVALWDNSLRLRLHQYQVIIYVEIPYLQKTYGSLHVSADLAAVGERTFQETLQFRPKSEISNLLCRDSKISSHPENKVKLSASACDSWIKRTDN